MELEEEIFHIARALPPGGERDAYLEAACAGDPSLLLRLRRLLWVLVANPDFCEPPAPSPPPAPLLDPTHLVGQVIGPYRVVSLIGEGGMGVVYKAEHTLLATAVALKIIKPGMNTSRVIERFETERKTLALMDDVHISRVLGAGTTEQGLPYFVMELVDGVNITAFCSANQHSLRDRLQLFLGVCRGVRHAHVRGIIHRDIKPSNILVTQAGGVDRVKVIDFGIAKAMGEELTERTLTLGACALQGTPAYMSPEQADSPESVDTRSDVYSLGAVLYELLSGKLPFDLRELGHLDVDRIRHHLRAVEPRRPSARVHDASLAHALRGELDWIVMKAMAKEPDRRYESVADLEADLANYLDGSAVVARPPSPYYRARKYFWRHRAFLLTAGLVASALIAGTVFSTRSALEAAAAKRDAIAASGQYQAQLFISERHRYASDLGRAAEALKGGYIEHAQDILDQIGPSDEGTDPRDFAWYYLRNLARRDVIQFPHHNSSIHSLATLEGGRRVAYGTTRGEVFLVDTAGQSVRELPKAHSIPVDYVGASPDGRFLLSHAAIGNPQPLSEIRVWDPAASEVIRRFDPPHNSLDGPPWFLESGRVLAVLRPPGAPAESACQVVEIDQETTSHPLATYSSQVNIFRLPDGWAALDLATGQLTRHDLLSKDSPVGPPVAVSQAIVPISPTVDGDRAFGIAPDQSALILLDLRSGAVVRSTPLGNSTLREVLIAPGSRLIAWQDELGRVHSWATETGARREFPVERLDRGDVSIFMALSPDGRRLALSTWGIPGSQTPIKVHDTQTGAELATFPGSPTRLGELAFSDDSAFLFIGSGNSLKRWDLDPPPLVTFAGHLDEAWAASFTPDGRILLTGADDTDEPQTIKAWEFATGRLLGASHPHPALVNCISLSPDGRRAVTSGLVEHHNLSLWDVRDPADPSGWRLIRELEGHGRPVRAALYRPDGKMIATAGDDLKIRLWDGVSGDLLHTLTGHTDKILQLAFSPDSKLLASVSNDKSVRIWDLNLMHAIWIPDGADPFTALAFSPDGKILAAADQTGRIVLIDPLSGGEIHRIHSDLKEIRALAYSPDGRLLASGGVDQIIRIWDTLTQREIFALGDPDGKKGPFGQINGLTFSPDGLSLISTHHSGAVILWDGHPPEDR